MTTIRHARATDAPDIVRLVAAGGLADVDPAAPASTFVVAERDGAIVGCGGIEFYDVAGLVRSVLVDEPFRGTGIGRRLVEHVEAIAFDAGLAAVYLLTVDAGGFFERLGYERVERSAAPDGIAGSPQFVDQCASSAACLYKPL